MSMSRIAHARLIGEEMPVNLLCLIMHHVRAPLSSWTKMQGQLMPTDKVPEENTQSRLSTTGGGRAAAGRDAQVHIFKNSRSSPGFKIL